MQQHMPSCGLVGDGSQRYTVGEDVPTPTVSPIVCAKDHMVFWADVRELTLATGGTPSVTMKFETSPTKDEVLFQTMASTVVSVASPITPLPKVILAAAPAVPLATWVRWRLTPTGTTGPWDVTFRLLAAANRVARGAA